MLRINESKLGDAAALLARVLLSTIFIIDGWGKMAIYAAAQAYMEQFSVPSMLLPLVILTEVGCGLAVLAGWQTRWAALALAGFSILAAVIFHHNFGNRNEMLHFQKDLAIAGGLLALVAFGAGRWSLDGRRS